MANWLKSKESNEFSISISRYRTEDYYAEYEIWIKCAHNTEWKVYKRYSDFKKLKDKLNSKEDKFKVFFPPKKSFNNMSPSFLNNRRKSLEMYLNEVLSMCGQLMPRALAYFLEMQKYEIHGITTEMAKSFFLHGHFFLKSNITFELPVLSVYSINQRMSSPVPTNLYQKKDEDFGNVLDVVESLKKVRIAPNSLTFRDKDCCYGTSNIRVSDLTFDLSIFTSVTDLELNSLEMKNLRGLFRMNSTVERLRVHHSLKALSDLLFADFAYGESTIDLLQKLDGPLRCATDVNLSHNSITNIDQSIVTLRQVRVLNLSFNQISDLQHMYHLIFLTELDLSHNHLHMSQFQSLSNKLGSIKKLTLVGNKLVTLNIVDRMFSLEYLDVSDNLLANSFSLLSLCRLSCLESLTIKDNPVCSVAFFPAVVFDLFLDRHDHVRVNGALCPEAVLNLEAYRNSLRQLMFLETHNQLCYIEVSRDVCDLEAAEPDSLLTVIDVYNIFLYWFFLVTGSYVCPKKLLWATEIFPPSLNIRPRQVLLVTSGTRNPSLFQCRLSRSPNSDHITIRPTSFVDLSVNFQHMVIGADKSFLRLDVAADNRDLFLTNNAIAVESFICHLYHVDDGMASFGDARILYLNEEDRFEMMRRFVDLWRIDMSILDKRPVDRMDIRADIESDLLFISRSMLQMKNGFQILLTVVVTQDIMYLVDERIYDWPSFNKTPNLSELSSGNSCSPYTSSCGQFPFLRTNAYFLGQIDVCTDENITEDSKSLIDMLCPMFRYPVQIVFNSLEFSMKDPLKLLFENEQKTHQLCQLVHQHSEALLRSFTPVEVVQEQPPTPRLPPSEHPAHLRQLAPSYSEIRLSIALCCPRLSKLALLPPLEVLAAVQDLTPRSWMDDVITLFWTKFLHLTFNGPQGGGAKERPGLVCISSAGICVLQEIDEALPDNGDACSDPEVDQPEVEPCTRLEVVLMASTDVFRVHVGLNHQWVTVCCRPRGTESSESERLVLLLRNKDHCKHVVTGLCSVTGQAVAEVEGVRRDDCDVKELLFQIQRTADCGEIDFVHYCSLEDLRFDPSMPRLTSNDRCEDMFSSAAVITTENIALIRHNIGEYPVRQFSPGTIRQSPRHLQYQVLAVIPLFDCLQLQLPGHDRTVLILVVRDSGAVHHYTTTVNIQLSISCQKEQKRLIDKLRQQRSKCLQIDTPLRVSVC